jgi:uncharacterized membrane protein YgdD (TMEM256/DUF423 family)
MDIRTRIAAAAALFGATAVGCGAFAAHGLRAVLDPQALGWWETAATYQMWHALALLALAAAPVKRAAVPALLFGAGILIFSGSLYLMALSGLRWIGAVTPIGGSLLIAGWTALLWQAMRSRD